MTRRPTPTLLLTCLLAFALAACPPPRPDPPPGGGTHTTSTPTAAADFAEAVTHYEAGRFRQAVEAFRLFLALHAGDERAVRAEFYLGRSLAATGETLEAARLFEGLYRAPDDATTRRAAAMYRAFVASLRGEADWGRGLLVEELRADAAFGPGVDGLVPGDEAPIAALLAEAELDAGDPLGAFDAWAWMQQHDPTDDLRDYAVDRAMGVAAELPLREVRDLVRVGTLIGVAAATPVLVNEALRAGDPDAASEAFAQGEPALLALGQLELVGQLRGALAQEGSLAPPTWGVVLSLSGPNRRAARAALGAALLAQRAFEDREPRSLLRIYDTLDDPRATREAVRALADAGATVIVGPIVPELADVARDEGERLGVPVVTLSTQRFDAPQGDGLRWMADPVLEADAVLDAALARGVRSVAIVRDADRAPYLEAFADAVRDGADARGMDVVREVDVLDDADDGGVLQASADAAAAAIARTSADGVVLATTATQAAAVVAYLATEDIWPSPDGSTRSSAGRRRVTYAGHSFLVDAALLLNSSRYLEGAIVPVWFDAELAIGDARAFADRFAWTYGRDAGVVEAFAFDAASLALATVLDAGIRAPSAAGAWLRDGDHVGVVGRVAFDEAGNPAVAPALLTVADGDFEPLTR